jgi:hypothetical protein
MVQARLGGLTLGVFLLKVVMVALCALGVQGPSLIFTGLCWSSGLVPPPQDSQVSALLSAPWGSSL